MQALPYARLPREGDRGLETDVFPFHGVRIEHEGEIPGSLRDVPNDVTEWDLVEVKLQPSAEKFSVGGFGLTLLDRAGRPRATWNDVHSDVFCPRR